jgi:hypothetical protein
MKKMKNNTIDKRKTTKSTKYLVDRSSRSSRLKKWNIPPYVRRNSNKDRTRKNTDYLREVPGFGEQRHSGIPIDFIYISPIKPTLNNLKSIPGHLQEEELQYLDNKVLNQAKAEELIKKLPSITQKNQLWWHRPLLNIGIENEIVNLKSILGNLQEEELQCLNNKVLNQAEELIKKLRSITHKNQLWWHRPLLNISIENEIVLEWWHKEKKLTIYICPNTIDFIKVWGADMDDEMDDGLIDLSDNDAILSLWQWIALSKNN